MPESSRLEFLEKFFTNNYVLSDTEYNLGPLNRGGIADLPLLRTLIATCNSSNIPRVKFVGNDELFFY